MPDKTPQSRVAMPGVNAVVECDSVAKTSNAQASISVVASESVRTSMCLPGEWVINIGSHKAIFKP